MSFSFSHLDPLNNAASVTEGNTTNISLESQIKNLCTKLTPVPRKFGHSDTDSGGFGIGNDQNLGLDANEVDGGVGSERHTGARVEEISEEELPAASAPSEPTKEELELSFTRTAEETLLDIRELIAHGTTTVSPEDAVDVDAAHSGPDSGSSKPLDLDVPALASLSFAVSQFMGEGDWANASLRAISQDILSALPSNSSTVSEILTAHVKPLFLPHPFLSTSARRLQRPAGGPNSNQDMYEAQSWKDNPGLANVLAFCIEQTKDSQYESIWHLLMPPLLNYLDDYSLPHRIQGMRLLSSFLDRVPPDLLRRTGVDEVIRRSLETSTQLLSSPQSPTLLNLAIPLTLRLINISTPPSPSVPSTKAEKESQSKRYTHLTHLLSEQILGHIFLYTSTASQEGATIILATLEALPSVLRELGAGGVRFMKALLATLLHLLTLPTSALLQSYTALEGSLPPSTHRALLTNLRLQDRALAVLNVVLDTFPVERVEAYKEQIFLGIARGWIGCWECQRWMKNSSSASTEDAEGPGLEDTPVEALKAEAAQLDQTLRNIYANLGSVCDLQVEAKRLSSMDLLFSALLESSSPRNASTPNCANPPNPPSPAQTSLPEASGVIEVAG